MTSRSSFVVGDLVFPGNPYDGHSLSIQLGQVERISGKNPADANRGRAPVVFETQEQGGDVFGQADTVRPKYDRNVSITIAEIVPWRIRRFALPVNERILRYMVAYFREQVLTS